MSRQELTLGKLLNDAIEAKLMDLHVSLPCSVESYDIDNQTVDVKPLLKRVVRDRDQNEVVETLPVIPSVPVAFPRGGGFFISFPLVQGDTGHVIFCERSIDQWVSRGGDVDPGDMRLHPLDGAVFYPNLAPDNSKLGEAHADNLVVGLEGGKQIHIKPGGTIDLGSEGAGDALALASVIKSDLDDIKSQFDSLKNIFDIHVHPSGVGPTGQTVTPFVITYSATDPASSVIKAE